MPQPVVHFEITGGDPLALQQFYRDLFGWEINNMADMGNYGLVDTKSTSGINGAVGASEDGAAFLTFYIAVADPQATLDQIEGLGGKVLAPVTEIPGVVTFAVFMDPFGHAIGLVKDGEGGDERTATGGVSVDWFEILGDEPKKILEFYGTVFGWEAQDMSSPEMEYHILTAMRDGHGINGGIGGSKDGTPVTTVYATVPDVAAHLEKATSLGATPVMGPMDVPNGPTVAAFTDPAGNLVGLASGM